MQFTPEFVESVAKGESLEEVDKLPFMARMALGIAVRQFEESQGKNRDKVNLDDNKIAEFLKQQNK
ncbi:hypothetical protein [Mesobacillus jeotgali]|uniref:hypothetical protein n=1 Tax=Mesobacillus jeotgali TaxID=129985 RepID=UPI000C81C48B|nr:hypothetical protein [Mesobacillus jeotgali]